MPSPQRLHVELEPVTGASWAGVPPEVRLRRLLKLALRSCGLRVVTVEHTHSDESADPRAAAQAILQRHRETE